MAKKSRATYIPNKNIQSLNVKNGKRVTEIKNKDILDGAYVRKGVKYEDGGMMAKGGSMKVGDKKVYNKLVGRKGNEYYFLDYIFKHDEDFMGATGTIVTPVHSNYFEYATSRDGLAERYLDAMSESEWCNTLGLDEDDCTEEEIIDGIENLYRAGELQPFEECSSEEENQMREIAEFSDSNKYPLFEVIGGGRSFDADQKFDEVYDKTLLALIIKAESKKLAKGGGVGDELMGGQPNKSEKSGYNLLKVQHDGKVIIVTDNNGETKERWVKNNGYSGYTLRYNGNEYEFADSFNYAKGGGLSSKQDKANKKLEKHIEYEFVNTDMGSGWAFSLDGFDLEMKYLDVFDSSDLGIEEDWDDLSKEDKKYYYEDWKDSLFESSYEQFKNLAFKKYGNYYMENGGNMNDDKSYICTYEIGGL